MKLDDYFKMRRLGSPSVGPAGESLVFTVSTLNSSGNAYLAEIWQLNLTGEPTPRCVHSSALNSTSPRLGNDGSLYFLSKLPNDPDGDLGTQVWRKRVGQEEAERVTDEPLGVSDYRIAAGRLLVLANVIPGVASGEQRAQFHERNKNGPSGQLYTNMPVRSWDHWTAGPVPHLIEYGADAGLRRDLCPGFMRELSNDHGLDWDLSADGKTVATTCIRPGPDRQEDSSILVIDIQSGEHRYLGVEDSLTHSSLCISPDGKRIASVGHRREYKKSGTRLVRVYSLVDDTPEVVVDAWQVTPTVEAWHGDGALLVTTPDNGHAPLYRLDIASSEMTQISATSSGGTHSSISCVDSSAVGIRHTFASPPEMFRVVLEAGREPEMLTALSGVGELSIRVENRSCLGDGDTPVQYFFLSEDEEINATDKESRKRATLLWIHGGPVSSWTDGWHWRWNPLLMLAQGYNVALPNPRGSTGFGQEFIEGISGNQWGAACYRDLMAVCDELVERDDVDPDKLVAMGGSFGGYMSNWVATQSDRFAAIVTHASLYRLSAFHGATDYPAYWAHDMGLYPSEDPDEFDRYSPHRFVDSWNAPTLIIHGEKDYRVPISEGLMLFEDLQKRGVDASLLVFPDENHWIVNPRNARQWYQECLNFLASRLPNSGSESDKRRRNQG